MSEMNGVPMLLNMSFNDSGEPIVCTPEDALRSFRNMSVDCLALENFLVEKKESGGA